MPATIHHMSLYRSIFVLEDPAGWVVFMASVSGGRPPCIAHQKTYADHAAAARYGRELAATFQTEIVGVEPDDKNQGVA